MTKEEIISALNDIIDELNNGLGAINRMKLIGAFQAIRAHIELKDYGKTPKRLLANKPKDWGELWSYVVKELGLTDDDARYLWNNWQANGFSRNGTVILDWRAAARAWKAGHFYPSQKQK